MFWNKKKEDGKVQDKKIMHSDEYEFVLKRLSEITSEISAIKADVKLLGTDLSDLRGKIDSRLRKIRERDKQTESEDITQDLNYGDPIPYG